MPTCAANNEMQGSWENIYHTHQIFEQVLGEYICPLRVCLIATSFLRAVFVFRYDQRQLER